MSNSQKNVDLVIIDDNKHFTDVLISNCFYDKVVESYQSPDDFLKIASKYSLDTKIIIDNILPGGKEGVEIARELHDKGYTHLYILTGDTLETDRIPGYLTVIIKTDLDNIKKLLM